MSTAPRIPRARAIALAHPAPAEVPWREWVPVAITIALLLAGLLGL
jgi:hypothetical protein